MPNCLQQICTLEYISANISPYSMAVADYILYYIFKGLLLCCSI